MTTENYVIAWGFYLLGGLGLFAFWCWLTESLANSSVKLVLRLLMLVMIMFPFNIGGGYEELAPGFLMLLLETVFEGPDAFFRVGTPMLTALFVTMVLATAFELFTRQRRRRQAAQAELDGEHDALLKESRSQPQQASGDVRREPTI